MATAPKRGKRPSALGVLVVWRQCGKWNARRLMAGSHRPVDPIRNPTVILLGQIKQGCAAPKMAIFLTRSTEVLIVAVLRKHGPS